MSKLSWFYYGIAISQALHSTEEVLTGLWAWLPRLTTAWHEKVNRIPVLLGWGETNFAVANLVIVAALLALMPFVFERRTWALKLAFWIAVVEIINGAGHLMAAMTLRGYFPGVLAGLGLLFFGVLYIRQTFSERKT